MESFSEVAGKETCVYLYLRKGKLFLQLFCLLRFTVVAKKEPLFCRIYVTMNPHFKPAVLLQH